MFMNNQPDLNQMIERIVALYDSGGNPNQFMQQIVQRQLPINQMATQYNNMKQGRSNAETIMQLAKQSGVVSEQNLQGLARILKIKA